MRHHSELKSEVSCVISSLTSSARATTKTSTQSTSLFVSSSRLVPLNIERKKRKWCCKNTDTWRSVRVPLTKTTHFFHSFHLYWSHLMARELGLHSWYRFRCSSWIILLVTSRHRNPQFLIWSQIRLFFFLVKTRDCSQKASHSIIGLAGPDHPNVWYRRGPLCKSKIVVTG